MDDKGERLERRIAVREMMPTIPDPTVNASAIAIEIRLLKETRAKLEVRMDELSLDDNCRESIRRAVRLASTVDIKNATREELMNVARLADDGNQGVDGFDAEL